MLRVTCSFWGSARGSTRGQRSHNSYQTMQGTGLSLLKGVRARVESGVNVISCLFASINIRNTEEAV